MLAEFYGPGPRTEHSVEALEVLARGPGAGGDRARLRLLGIVAAVGIVTVAVVVTAATLDRRKEA